MAERFIITNATTPSLVISIGVATVLSLSLVRAFQRSRSPVIRSKLSCKCGKIQGEISAIKYDSQCLNCYCKDCRDYGKYIASLGKHKETAFHGACGESCLLQVCKSDLKIHSGQKHLRLARKAPGTGMHRFYAGCCHTPILNTFDFLGFVGILRDVLDGEHEKFGPPVRCFQEEALSDSKDPEPNLFVPSMLWKLLRYHYWRKSGFPFDYEQEPVFWGIQENGSKHE